MFLFVHWIAPKADVPWRPRSAARRLFRTASFAFVMPWLMLSPLLDHLLAPLFARAGWSNTYRAPAQRRAVTAGASEPGLHEG